jgi:hypothetical protein
MASTPKIPKGWKVYSGAYKWQLIPGAKYWDVNAKKWAQVEGKAYIKGAHAIPNKELVIVPTKKRSFTAYCATQVDGPTKCALNYKRKDTLARVREIWGKDYRRKRPNLRIVKVIVSEA